MMESLDVKLIVCGGGRLVSVAPLSRWRPSTRSHRMSSYHFEIMRCSSSFLIDAEQCFERWVLLPSHLDPGEVSGPGLLASLFELLLVLEDHRSIWWIGIGNNDVGAQFVHPVLQFVGECESCSRGEMIH